MPVKKQLGKRKENIQEIGSAQPARETRDDSRPRVKRVCIFCESKTEPTYADSAALRRFMSDRAKIVTKARTGACSKHQRRVTKEIKHARHLALLPFVAKI